MSPPKKQEVTFSVNWKEVGKLCKKPMRKTIRNKQPSIFGLWIGNVRFNGILNIDWPSHLLPVESVML